MLDVLTGFAIIFVVIGVGFVLAHRGVIGKGEARLQFNRTAFWAATPALIFSSVATSDTSAFASPVVAVIAAASVATMLLYWLCSRLLFPRSGAETMAGAAAASYYNSVNIGLPIATYVIGDATYVIPALVLQMAVLSPFIIAGLNAQGTSLRSIWGSVLAGITAPVVLAAVAGFCLRGAVAGTGCGDEAAGDIGWRLYSYDPDELWCLVKGRRAIGGGPSAHPNRDGVEVGGHARFCAGRGRSAGPRRCGVICGIDSGCLAYGTECV